MSLEEGLKRTINFWEVLIILYNQNIIIMRIVIAFGGNALLRTDRKTCFESYTKTVEEMCKGIAYLMEEGHEIVLTHGNGPQVGNILIQQEMAKDEVFLLPLDVCVAETQAQIGYLLQQNLTNELTKRGIRKKVVTLVTRVLVNKNDPAFKNPTKPVGPFYLKKPREYRPNHRIHMTLKKIGKKYRRVVPSPKPIRIVERDEIKRLVEDNFLVIACGGGGIPVVKEKGKLKGVEAVVDKDLSAQLLATLVNADLFLILMEADGVYLNYGERNQRKLDKLSIEEAQFYLTKGQFPPGSMGPKIEATIKFLESGGKKAIIASWKDMAKAVKGKAGTIIVE